MRQWLVHWLLEFDVFGAHEKALAEAAQALGHKVTPWNDDWWRTERFPVDEAPTLFHGSLNNAARIKRTHPWQPGVYCDVEAFACSSWYEALKPWLLHEDFVFSTVKALVAEPASVIGQLQTEAASVFVRPDSPLKPFSGRVVPVDGISRSALDHGFYYEDETLPIVVAPVRKLGKEWRFVVVDGAIVAGSEYQAQGRTASKVSMADSSLALRYAKQLVSNVASLEPVWVLDVCEVAGEFRLLELGPFSGADLYGCDPHAVIEAIATYLE